MPIPEDERFEQYLKKFQPLAPEPLPALKAARGTRRWLALGAFAVALAAVLVVVLLLHPHPKSGLSPDGGESKARVEAFTTEQPLTIGTANALLARATSAKAAVDDIAAQALQVQSIPSSEHMQSALAALSKEKTKL
jgi:preprotein translocase subunit SecG